MENITKTAMVTIAGRPNVGKSTLVNALVGEKIAIVSSKPQTTRNRICGVVNQGDTQFIFLDTPGFHKARTRLGDYMVKVVKDSVADVEAVCLLVEPIANVGAPEQALIDRIREERLPAVLVINKIDTVEKAQLLEVMAAYSAAYDFDAIIPISAQEKDRVRRPGPPALPRRDDHRPAGTAGSGGNRAGEASSEPGQGGPPRHRHRSDEVLRTGQRNH